MSVVYIYGLVDPRNELIVENVRYVGKTKRKLIDRYKQHLRDSKKYKTPVNYWIRRLLKKNFKPEIIQLDVCDLTNWRYFEKKYIRELRKTNKLLNVSDGGYGIEDKSRLVRVYQYNEFGNEIKNFDSIADAAVEMGVVPSTISGALNQKFNKSSCGYYWFKSKQKAKDFCFVRPRQFQKPILSYTLEGIFFKRFENISIASKLLNIPKSNIIHSISSYGSNCAGNYLWFYVDKVPEIVYQYQRNGYVPIVQKNKHNEKLNEYKSISEASRETGISYGVISRSIKGKIKSYDDFIFKNKII